MPKIEIELDEKEFARLQEAHRVALQATNPTDPGAVPPDFGKWLGQVLPSSHTAQENHSELNAIRAFTAIEKFVFNLHQRGFMLAQPGKAGGQQPRSQQELAQAVVNDLQLLPNHVKRIQDMLAHFSKTPMELAEAANIALTSRGQAALLEAYRLLVERTEKAADNLGVERAIGRVEGSAAMLVSVDIVDRDSAKKKTDEFKIKARTGALSK